MSCLFAHAPQGFGRRAATIVQLLATHDAPYLERLQIAVVGYKLGCNYGK
jgi:hypothetical protein